MIQLQALTRPVSCTFDPRLPVRDVLHQLEQRKISGAPVVDHNGDMVGYISQSGVNLAALRKGDLKLTAGQVMTPFVFTFSPEADLTAALNTMVESRIHRIITVDSQNRPLGVLTTLDVLRATLGQGPVRFLGQGLEHLEGLLTRRARDLMNTQWASVRPCDNLANFLVLSERLMIHGAPVISPEDDFLVGMISQSDISHLLWSTDRGLYQTRVMEIMTPFVYRANVSDDFLTLVQTMVKRDIHRLMVLRGDKQVGIITALDIMAKLAKFLKRAEARNSDRLSA